MFPNDYEGLLVLNPLPTMQIWVNLNCIMTIILCVIGMIGTYWGELTGVPVVL